MKLGIVGMPNTGKSTLFNAMTCADAEAANYPSSSVKPNIGTVPVPDPRLGELAKMYNPKKITPTAIEFVDIVGLVAGSSKGAGLGNKFLTHIRQVDAILHVVRCFDDTNIVHVLGNVDAARDIDIINTELILSDLEFVDRRIEKAKKMAKGDKKYGAEAALFERLYEFLDGGSPARLMPVTDDERAIVATCDLLSNKPVIYAANMDEQSFSKLEDNVHYNALLKHAGSEGAQVLPVCAKLEQDIAPLDAGEKELFLSELGLNASGLDRLISCSYELLGLISFLTAGTPEVRAWTIARNTKAPQAAGKIHSDLERGFIRAEVVAYDDLMSCGSMAAAKDKGLVRSEGKEYIVKDGDVILFRFNV